MIDNDIFFEMIKSQVKMHEDDSADFEIVKKIFENKSGKFLCIGANNGLNDPCHWLLTQGWHGVYCEPDPFAFCELLENTDLYQGRVKLLNVAISNTTGLTHFFVLRNKSSLSSLDENWTNNPWYENSFDRYKKQKIVINTISMKDLLSYIGQDFDYVQIDTEGHDLQIITSIDWSLLTKCELISTECMQSALYYLANYNFDLSDLTPTNGFYRKNHG